MTKKILILLVVAAMALMIGCSAPPQQEKPADKPTAAAPTTEAPAPVKTVSAEDMRVAKELVQEANKLRWDNKLKDAEAKLKEAIEKNPNEIDAYTAMADVHTNGNDYSKAVDVLDEALKLDPKNLKVMKKKAEVLRGKKDYAASNEVLVKIVEMDPKDMDAMLDIARNYSYAKENDKAEAQFQKAVDTFSDSYRPAEAFADYYKSASFQFSEKDKKADMMQKSAEWYIKAFDKLTDKDEFWKPGMKYRVGEAFYWKWLATKDDKDKDAAIKAFDEYKKIKPDHVWMNSADNYIKEMKAGK